MAATILIVDDARLNRELFKLSLVRAGYRVLEAENGRQAVEIMESRPVDLVLLDLIMPVMDGFEFLHWRNSNPAYTAIPVIVHSALDDFQSIERALSLDSYDYFTKPLTEHDIKVVLPLKVKNAVNAKRLYFETMAKNERLNSELELAARYQRFLLPEDCTVGGARVATFYRPHIGVAGDFFDVVEVDGDPALIMADVSGHGLLSAMVSSILKPLFSYYVAQTGSPRKTLERLNRDLLSLTREEDYVTAFCAIHRHRDNRLVYASAGHPAQWLWSRGEEQVIELQTGGFLLGMFPADHPAFEQAEESIAVGPGDRLLAFTDGLIEAKDGDGLILGPERARERFGETVELPPRAAADSMWDLVADHGGQTLQDDIALLMVDLDGSDD